VKEIYNNLFIGNDNDCAVCALNSSFSVVHACKTCHQKALGYKGSLPPSHPHYLTYELGTHLFLNMVDMPNELSPIYTNPIISHAIGFINRKIKNNKIIIHCNQGQSRSPALGLIYLAKTNVITKNSYNEAKNEFMKLFPGYSPGTGILLYMQHNCNYSDLKSPCTKLWRYAIVNLIWEKQTQCSIDPFSKNLTRKSL
jgi:hypothetical protein